MKQFMSQMLRTIKLISISNKAQRYYGSDRNFKTYYEILRLPQDASKKDIRSAFIKLSKEVHPDTSSKSTKSSHDEFVKINEAYNVLSKDHSRQQYDIQLKYSGDPYNSTFHQPDPTYRHHYQYQHPMWYGYRGPRSHGRFKQGYYRNMDPNVKYYKFIIFICILISMISSIIHFSIVLFRARYNHQRIMNDSERYRRENLYTRLRPQPLGTRRASDNLDNISIREDINDNEAENIR